jgi:hypothetical protein
LDLRVNNFSSSTLEKATVKIGRVDLIGNKSDITIKAAVELIGHGYSGHSATAI